MALSAIEQAYMARVSEAYAPTPEPEPEGLIGQTDEAMAAPKPEAEPKPQPSGVAEMKPYDPTVRQQLSDFLRAGFEGIGIDRAKARENAEALIGGPNSPLPLEIGIADFIPFLGTGLQTEEAYRMGDEAVESAKRGEFGAAALQAGGAALGMIPGAAGTYKYGKPIVKGLAAKAKAGELPVATSAGSATIAQDGETDGN